MCTTDADCAYLAPPTNWCITGAQCSGGDGDGECIVWPRCRNFPYLGCLNASQLCVTTRIEDQPPLASATSTPSAIDPAAAGFLLPLLLFLLVAITSTAVYAAIIVRRGCCAGVRADRRRRRDNDDTLTLPAVPMTTIDETAASMTIKYAEATVVY